MGVARRIRYINRNGVYAPERSTFPSKTVRYVILAQQIKVKHTLPHMT